VIAAAKMCEENKQTGNELAQRVSSVLQVSVALITVSHAHIYTGGPV
jgi:hypothetical protein